MKLLLALCLLIIPAFAQDDGPKPDRWRGMIIDETTPDDAIKAFGKPKSDKMGKFQIPILKNELTKSKDKLYRHLQFEGIDQVDKAILTFDGDKLVAIMVDLKEKLSPHAVVNSYNLPFEPVIDSFGEALYRGDMKRDQGKVYVDRYPSVYYLVATAERSLVLALVGNVPSLGKALGQVTIGTKDQAGTFPGKVEAIQIVSRKLENRDGADVLK